MNDLEHQNAMIPTYPIKNIIANFKSPKIAITTLVILVTVIISGTIYLYNNGLYWSKTIEKWNLQQDGNVDLSVRRNEVLHWLDQVNPFVGEFWVLGSGLPIYDLTFSINDFAHFKEIAEKSVAVDHRIDSLNTWRKTSLTFNGKEYPIDIRLHGKESNNFKYGRKNYTIKSVQPINGMRRFALINAAYRLGYIFNYELLRKLGILRVVSKAAILRINRGYHGIYIVEEKLHQDVLERNGMPDAVILKTTPDWTNHHTSFHESSYDMDVYHMRSKTLPEIIVGAGVQGMQPKGFPKERARRTAIAVSAMKTFLDAARTRDFDTVKSLMDVDFYAATEAFRMIINNDHYILGDNAKFIYDFSTGKLKFFYPRPEFGPVPLLARVGDFERQFVDFEYWGTHTSELAEILLKDDELRQRRNTYLWSILERKEEILNLYDQLLDKYGSAVARDVSPRISVWEKKAIMKTDRRILAENMGILEKYLDYSRGYVNVEVYNDNLKVRVSIDANSSKVFSRFEIKLGALPNNRKPAVYRLSPQGKRTLLGRIKTKGTKLDLFEALDGERFNNILDEKLRFSISETEYLITDLQGNGSVQDVFIELIDANSKDIQDVNVVISDFRSFETGKSFEREVLQQAGVTIADNNAVFKRGVYNIGQTLILPQGMGLTLQAGAKLRLGPDVSILVRGPFKVEGISGDMVAIQAADPQRPFGSVIVLGDGFNRCDISFLELSGGATALINGVYSSAALYINKCTTRMTHTFIHKNQGEEGLNVKRSKVAILNSKFLNNNADQVDLDFCKGEITSNIFRRGTFISGDGLDLSGSQIIISKNQFSGFEDKGVSVGERTNALIIRSNFEENGTAIAVKDSSVVYLFENEFERNALMISLYTNKWLFGPPEVHWVGPAPNSKMINTAGKARFVVHKSQSHFSQHLAAWKRGLKILDDLKVQTLN